MLTSPTFRQIEREISHERGATSPDSYLPRWYRGLLDVPVTDFSDKDLCIACRQEVFPEFIVPVVIRRLHENPAAGELYPGELIAAMACVPRAYWIEHPLQAHQVRRILERAIGTIDNEKANTSMAIMLRSFDSLIGPDFESRQSFKSR